MHFSARTAKRPGISVAMGITNRIATMFFGIYVLVECFIQGGWRIRMVLPAAVFISLLSFAVAWVWVKKTRYKLSIKKDVKPNDYILNSCEKLVVIALPEDVFDGANVRKTWFDFLLANVRKYAKEKHLTALVLGKYYVVPFRKYVADKSWFSSIQIEEAYILMHILSGCTKMHLIIEILQHRRCHFWILWNILLYYTIMCNRFLDLYNFGIRVDNTKIWAGYIDGYE